MTPAQNLLQNGTFDSDISPWAVSGGIGTIAIATFSNLDADGGAASGSIRVTTTTPREITGGGVLSECIPVGEGVTYQKRYDYLIEPAQETGVSVYGQVSFYSHPSCGFSGTSIAHGGIVAAEADGAWHASLDAADRYRVPAGMRAARLRLQVGKQAADGSATAHFDNVVFEALNDCDPLETPASLSGGSGCSRAG